MCPHNQKLIFWILGPDFLNGLRKIAFSRICNILPVFLYLSSSILRFILSLTFCFSQFFLFIFSTCTVFLICFFSPKYLWIFAQSTYIEMEGRLNRLKQAINEMSGRISMSTLLKGNYWMWFWKSKHFFTFKEIENSKLILFKLNIALL